MSGQAGTVQFDVCVYGGTSGGVVAAVAAARLGKNVCLIVQSNHVGGMTSGGLGVTDVGVTASIGGIAAEFYSRVGGAYGSTNPVYWFEPHVAERTFLQMLGGAGVNVYTNELLASVTMSNQVITQITMLDGNVYAAKEFIDTTYEGDLMAAAGVSNMVGREAESTYGESLAGAVVNSVQYPCDPYNTPGVPSSGVLPLIQTNGPAAAGAGDSKVQCYNFRLCLTQNPTNMIPITAPTNYSEATYELLHRYIEAYVATNGSVQLNVLIDVQTLIPNGKTDINAYAPISTDYIGYNFTYPTNNYAARQAVYQQHKNYIAGMLYYLATSTNVPLNVRTNMQSWGYAKDEFQDNGGWPYPLYVREARRMVGNYVMQQGDALGGRFATDSVALASYTLDCHPVARYAYEGGTVTEGGIGTAVPEPYPVSYRSIIPAAGQCQNLFCTFALSASHVGFASIRLEPPFMMLSQSAGTAAAFAIDDQAPVQSLNYQKLSAELLADGQLLAWSSVQPIATNGIILTVTNSAGVTVNGAWSDGSNAGGWPLPNGTYLTDEASGKGSKSVVFTPSIPTNGYYDVYLWWVYASNRATNVAVRVTSASATNTVVINQQINCTNWVKIVSSNYFKAAGNGAVTVSNLGTASGAYVIANAVRWMPLGSIASLATPPPPVEVIASDAVGGEFGTNEGRFTFVCPDGTNATPLAVYYTVSGSARAGVDYAPLAGSVTIPAGALAASVIVAPSGGNLANNQETVTISLATNANYVLGSLTNATVTIQDWPINIWRRANFTAAQLNNPAISGDTATPANDGVANLMKYALGLPPLTPCPNPFNPVETNGACCLSFTEASAAPDVSLAFFWSPNLINWYSGPSYLQLVNITNQLFQLKALTPSSTNSFIQVQAILN